MLYFLIHPWIDGKKAETIYYIYGWLLFACKSESLRRGVTSSANNIMYLVETCSLNKKEPLPAHLPTAKITRTEKYGGLIYPVESFLFVY